MKNALIGLLFASLTTITNAQTQENYSSTVAAKAQSAKVLNPAYLQQVNQGMNAQIVNDLEVLAATYDITKENIYLFGVKTSYNVRLGNGKNQINAVYDHNGQLIRSEEKYVDIVLPLSLRVAISKKYPGWAFTESSYELNYILNKKVERYCSLTLERGDKKIHVKYPIPESNSLDDVKELAYGV